MPLHSSLAERGVYSIDADMHARLRETFGCGFATDEETKGTIRSSRDDVLGTLL